MNLEMLHYQFSLSAEAVCSSSSGSWGPQGLRVEVLEAMWSVRKAGGRPRSGLAAKVPRSPTPGNNGSRATLPLKTSEWHFK